MTRVAVRARTSGLSSPFCSVSHVAVFANLRSARAAVAVSYAFVETRTRSARLTPGTDVATSGRAIMDVLPVIRRPDLRIAFA